MDGRVISRFHLYAAVGCVVMHPLEVVECGDWLQLVGIASQRVEMIPRAQQLTEKLHAYTLSRSSANNRVKDLVDLALPIRSGEHHKKRVAKGVHFTFQRRETYLLPTALLAPRKDWQTRFRTLANKCRRSTDIAEVFAVVRSFLDNVRTTGGK